jgi:hypothetical protein
MQLEDFDPIRRPREWFLRCRKCQAIGPVYATADEAVERWCVGDALACTDRINGTHLGL